MGCHFPVAFMAPSSGHGGDGFSLDSVSLLEMSCVAALVHGHQGKHS